MYRMQALRNSLLFEPCSKYSESAPFQDKGDERSKPLLPRAVRPSIRHVRVLQGIMSREAFFY
jgi:hypothetical protein